MAEAGNFSQGDVRYESTFEMTPELFKEFVSARDKALNQREGRSLVLVFGVLLVAYIAGTVLIWKLTAWGIAVGAIFLALFVYAAVLAITGFTLFWPERSWQKTERHYFARHGAEGDPAFTLRTSACLNEVRSAVLTDGRASGITSGTYSSFSHVAESAHLVVLVSKENHVGTLMGNLFASDYAQKLEERQDAPAMIFCKTTLLGGTPDELVAYLERKLGLR